MRCAATARSAVTVLDIHVLRVPDHVPPTGAAATLSTAEQATARRLVRPADQRRSLWARITLRHLLGQRLGVAPGAIELERGPCPGCGAAHGRPQLAGRHDVELSVSHSGAYVIIALASCAVGVDLERIEPAAVADLSGALHDHELAAFRALRTEERANALFGCWVRKEAYLKGLGIGLGRDPATVPVGWPSPGQPARCSGDANDGAPGWALVDLPAPPGYVAAAAVEAEPGTVGLTCHTVAADEVAGRTRSPIPLAP
jgi:4'-phosphopantetheinyl transferase